MRKNELEKSVDEVLDIIAVNGSHLSWNAVTELETKLTNGQKEYQKTKFADSIAVLTEALSADKSEGSYYHAWQANIAMAFKDEWQRREDELIKTPKINSDQPEGEEEVKSFTIHDVANEAAKNFLDMLCGIKTQALDESEATPPQEELSQRSE